MPTTRRKRKLPASPAEVWEVVGDPYHLPRWWPKVTRVESVDHAGFTQVMLTEKGRSVRADFRLTSLEEPVEIAWSQEVEGTPFARVLVSSETTVRLEPDGEGTKVTIQLSQSMKGMSKLGGPMVTNATKSLLDEALDGLAALYA